MVKYNSGRQKNIKVGVQSYSENLTSLEGIGSASFTGKGTFNSGVDANYIEIGVGASNLIYSTVGNLELNSQGGRTNIDDIVTISGNLGVGTDNPTCKLDINGDIKIRAGLYDFTNNVGTAGSVLFSTGSGVVWDNIGNAGEGITISDSPLSLFPYYILFTSSTSGISTIQYVSPNKLTYVEDTGSLGIGTTNPTSKLHIVGDVNISGILTATDINSSSDIRLKKNIKKFENTLEKIDEINGVSFEWKQSGSKSAGIIAQDLEKVFPELVIDTSEYKKVNYNGLIGVLIETIKELKQEVQNLKSEVNDLKYK